jgi:hypothetical protein
VDIVFSYVFGFVYELFVEFPGDVPVEFSAVSETVTSGASLPLEPAL